MKKAGIVLALIVMLWALILPATGVVAATDGYYQLGEVSQPAWDSTSASRTKAPTADYDYTYGDESSVTYTLPWSFSFYGQSYTQITADTNGNIWFTATGSAHSFDLATTGRGPVIAAWNNDLSSYFHGGVFIQHKTNPERVVIEWQTETYSDEGTGRPNRFAVVLFPNGTIRADYGTFSPSVGKDFGTGISRGDGTASLSLTATYGNAFSLAGRSFLFASGSKIYVGSQTESFGDVPAGTASQPRTITLVNGGTDNLLISTVNLTANSSGMFSLAAGGDGCSGATLAPSQSCTVQAVFSPSALGPQSAVLSISSNDPTTPSLDIALSGTGLYPRHPRRSHQQGRLYRLRRKYHHGRYHRPGAGFRHPRGRRAGGGGQFGHCLHLQRSAEHGLGDQGQCCGFLVLRTGARHGEHLGRPEDRDVQVPRSVRPQP